MLINSLFRTALCIAWVILFLIIFGCSGQTKEPAEESLIENIGSPQNSDIETESPISGWDELKVILKDESEESFNVQDIAFNQQGAVYIAGISSGDDLNKIIVKKYEGVEWSSPQTVFSLVEYTYPVITIDDTGNALLVWRVYNREKRTNQLWTAKYIADMGWSTPERISSIDPLTVRFWTATSPKGDSAIFWEEFKVGSGSKYFLKLGNISAETFVFPEEMIPRTALAMSNGLSSVFPGQQLLFGPDGSVGFFAWSLDLVEKDEYLAFYKYDPRLGWIEPKMIHRTDGYIGDNHDSTRAGIDNQGNMFVLWNEQIREGGAGKVMELESLYRVRYSVESGWAAPETFFQLVHESRGKSVLPQLAVSGSGYAGIIFTDPQANKINVSLFDPKNLEWSDTVQFGDNPPSNDHDVRISVNDSGDYIVSWGEDIGLGSDSWVNYYDYNLGWGQPVFISQQSTLDVSVLPSGDAYWIGGNHLNIFMSRYRAN